MKKLFLAAMLVMGMTAVSCGDDSDDGSVPTPPSGNVSITVSPESLTLNNVAQDATLTITASAGWNISSDASWCSVFPSGGIKDKATDIRVSVTAHSAIQPRTATLSVRSGQKVIKEIKVVQNSASTVELSTSAITLGGQAQSSEFTVAANTEWTATSDASWLTVSPAKGASGETTVKVEASENTGSADRKAVVTIAYDGGEKSLTVTQLTDAIIVPTGYELVWNDEFNNSAFQTPDESLWWYEVWPPYYVNNELQRYVEGRQGSNITAEIKDGVLNIRAIKTATDVISARVNTRESWTYGYFEMRARLPKGKGTWPAFWMMPKNDSAWPGCGEIDIMEEVGADPNIVSSSIHCTDYNHTIGTQKTAARNIAGAEDEYHVYALEWTEDYIKTYVDGQLLFTFANDKQGKASTWPFDKPFYLKLNLAWGGDWGGYKGVDESALPATYSIDYVRVFKKK